MSLLSTTRKVSVFPQLSKTCPHCGKPLKLVEADLFGKPKTVPCWGTCGCERSARSLVPETDLSHVGPKRCPECGSMASTDRNGISDCVVCGFSFVAKSTVDEGNDAIRAFVEGQRIESMGGLMAAAGIPPLFQNAEPDVRAASEIAASGRGKYFQGGNGTQKTLAAAAVARAFLDMGKSVKFVSSSMLVSEFRDSMGGSRSEADMFEELFQADLLVLDDLGKENVSEWTVSLLFSVIDGRYGYNRPILVTSNYSKAELGARLSTRGDSSTAKAIVSRLFEMTDKVDFGNEDRRLS